jgi:hypothetical protein
VLLPLCLLALLASVPLLGGRLAALADLRFRGAWLLGAALALQVLVISVLPEGAPAAHRGAHLASYGLAGAFVVANRRVRGLAGIGLGGAANALAIAANGGVMPMGATAARAAGIEPSAGFANSAVLSHPRLTALGDVLALPGSAFSPGDALILAGAAVLVHAACGTRLARPGAATRRAARGSAG